MIQVVNEVQEETKIFRSIPEFDAYYQKHKEQMDKQTTQYLNKIYKIETTDGNEYKITKKNCVKEGNKLVSGEVCLKKINSQNIQDNINADITMLKERIAKIEIQITEITDACNKLVHRINQL